MHYRAAWVPFCFLFQISLVSCGPDAAAFTQTGSRVRDTAAGPVPFEADATAAGTGSLSSASPGSGAEQLSDDVSEGADSSSTQPVQVAAADATGSGGDLDEPLAGAGLAGEQTVSGAGAQTVGPQTGTGSVPENPANGLPGAGNDSPEIIDVTAEILTLSDIRDLCRSMPHQTKVIDVVFPARNAGCLWNQGGNLGPVDGIVQARSEEIVSLELEETETLCGIRFESPAQEIIFDDELFLTFNDAILLSSYNYNAHFSLQDGFYMYAWEALIGGFNPGTYLPSESYCLGTGTPAPSVCEIPVTDTRGRFLLDVATEEAEKLSLLSKQQRRADIGLIITGDNDKKDCSHSEITVQVELTTVGGPALVVP